MKAIVLCAGQGKRLLPLTERQPKCLLPVDGERPVLEIQLETLARHGVREAIVMIGFGADQVEAFLARTAFPGMKVETLYNPFYALSDNLVTCWLARDSMQDDFLLLNGDTLFEDAVAEKVLSQTQLPIAVTIDKKGSYDDDDMKVRLDGSRLQAIGKTLPLDCVDGESIGMLSFRGRGAQQFREALERAVRGPDATRAWYLSVVNDLAQEVPVETVNIQGSWWAEIDDCDDLAEVQRAYPNLLDDEPQVESELLAAAR